MHIFWVLHFQLQQEQCRLISGFRRDGTDRFSRNVGMELPLLVRCLIAQKSAVLSSD